MKKRFALMLVCALLVFTTACNTTHINNITEATVASDKTEGSDTTADRDTGASDTEEQMKDKTYDILFIGNSYTYYNSTVPTEFKNIAASAGYTVNVDSVTKGGYTLLKFADSQDNMGAQVHEKLSTKKYDFVFIQEQSHTPVTNRENFYAGARALVQKIRDAGAVPVFYSTWGRQEGNKDIEKFDLVDNETMTWNLAAAYTKMGKELDVSVAYVGLAFRALYTGTNINLYHSDGSHPSPTGTFVAALTLFSTLFQVSTNDVTYDFGLQSSEWDMIKEAVETTVFNTPKIPDKEVVPDTDGTLVIGGPNKKEDYGALVTPK
jgi:hypothetical protein